MHYLLSVRLTILQAFGFWDHIHMELPSSGFGARPETEGSMTIMYSFLVVVVVVPPTRECQGVVANF